MSTLIPALLPLALMAVPTVLMPIGAARATRNIRRATDLANRPTNR